MFPFQNVFIYTVADVKFHVVAQALLQGMQSRDSCVQRK